MGREARPGPEVELVGVSCEGRMNGLLAVQSLGDDGQVRSWGLDRRAVDAAMVDESAAGAGPNGHPVDPILIDDHQVG